MKKTFLNSFFLTLVVALFSASSLWAQKVTFDFAANEWGLVENSSTEFSNLDKANIKQALVTDGVSAVVKYGKGTTSPRKYTDALRLYSNNILKVYAPSGKAITKIEFTAQGTYFKFTDEGLTDKTWAGNATMVKFTSAGGATRLTQMVVTLTDKTGETVTPAAEAEESITVDFDDSDTHSEFKNDDSEITADINVMDKAGSTGESRLYTLIPQTTATGSLVSKNKWYYITSEYTNTLRIFNETMVFKADPDKVIKSITMKVKTWNSANKINGETVTKSQIQAGVDVNANVVEFELGGQSVIYTITAVIADKPAAEEDALVPTAFVPADNSVLGNSFDAAFSAKFDDALTLDNEKIASIKLYKGSVDAANEIAPDVEWKARIENDKDLYIFSLDGDGFVQNIATEEGQKYILVIPAGIVKNASDVANAELTLTLNGPAPTIQVVSADPANNSTKSSLFAASFNITFDKEITIDNSKASSVKLYIDEVGGTEIAPESGAWSLAKESDGKTLRVFSLDEYGEGPQMITPEAGKKYILVVPAGAVKNTDGAENKEIKITLNGPVAPLASVAFDPADNSTTGNYFSATFTAKFGEALTLDAGKAADIKLYKGSVDAANEIAPEAGAWTAQLQNGNKDLYIFSLDEYGEGVQTIAAEVGQKYILVIPAGIVKNASDVANAELTLTLNGPAPTIDMVSSNPANNGELTNAFAATFDITFAEAITVNNAKAAEVKLYVDKVGGEVIAPESGAWSLAKESDGKTLRVFSLDEYGEGPQMITPEAGKKYILVVPAGAVKNTDGAENKEIKITLNGPTPAPKLVPTSYDPAEGSTLASYFSAAFTAKFDEALTLDNSKIASIKLLEKIGDTTTELTPDNGWFAALESGKKNLFIHGEDYDSYTQGFSAKEGAQYLLIIPAGIVKNADGLANEELILTLNGPAPTVALVSTNPANNATLEVGYLTKSFELTFDKAVSTTDALLNAGVSFTKNGVAVETESWGFNLSNGNKTVQVYGKDMDGFTDSYQVAAGDVFVLTIAKDVFATEAGAKSREIKLTLNGPELIPDVLALESSNPADGATLDTGYKSMSFELTFAQATTTTSEKLNAGVTLTKNGTKVDVESWGNNVNGKTVQVFGMDADGFTDTYKVEEGDVFVLTIAKGVFTAPGAENEQITITLNGPAAPVVFNPTKIEPGDGDELNKFYGNYAMPHLELTFDEDVAQILTTKPAIELRKGSVDGEVLPISGWKAEMVDETPNMITLDAWDYNVGSNIWFEAEDVDYYWIIPAGIVKNVAGGQNEQIILKQKGIVKNLTVASTTPADKGTIAPGYTCYQFYVTFEEEIQIVNATPNDDVKFYENGVEKEPFGADDVYAGGVNVWHALKDDAKTLYLWGDDGYEMVDGFTAIDGATYKLVIAPGIVQDAAGNKNGEITIEFTCSTGTGINGMKAASEKTAERYNLNGVRINASKKGVQIIRTADGRIVKVAVK